MKNPGFVVVVLMLVAFLVALPVHNASAAVSVDILVEKIDPQPAEPGKDLTLDVKLFNRLSGTTDPFSVTLDVEQPLVLKSASRELNQATLCGGCSSKVTYFLTVDTGAVSGVYPAYVRVRSGNTEIEHKIEINVQGKPNLIFSVNSEGLDAIVPDSQFSITLDVSNIGSGQAREIKIQSDSTNFIVLGSSLKTLPTLEPGAGRLVDFDFVAASTLQANTYSLPFRISYLDYQGNTINSTQNIGVRVVNKGSINIQSIKVAASTGSSVITAGQPFTVVIRLENTGKGNADGVVANLSCPFNGAPKRAFIGQLKKDEDAPAVFDFVSAADGAFRCTVMVGYEDDTNAYSFEEQLDIAIAPPDMSGLMLVPIVIIIILLIFRKRISRRSRAKK